MEAQRLYCQERSRSIQNVHVLLRRLQKEYGLELPLEGSDKHMFWILLKAIYGLEDAPLLWRKEIGQF